jgi:putative transposase
VPKGLLTLRPNTIWCSDITYLKAGGKHAYLSLVMDYHSRKIIGWQLSSTMKTEETLKALDKAILQAKNPQKIIHHSDRGSQYRSQKYRKRLALHGMTPSQTDGGKPYQNAK